MKTVELIYNPFTVETQILINGNVSNGKWSRNKNERLQMWLDSLFELLEEECNDDIELCFRGTELDYNDVLEAADHYLKTHNGIQISFAEPVLSKGVEGRLRDLITLFDYMQKECPFDDLRTEQIRNNFKEAIGSEFEVSVIATMSSGKSTLINAMLGRELMPAKNEACTATIARIKDNDKMEGFRAICRDKAGRVISQTDELTLEIMDQYNSNPEVAFIDIEGDIPFVPSENMQLVLQDTPGPNNSRTEEHKNHTFRVIKEKSKPMVLYILNATQLSTNDDNYLLNAVADAMKVGGKQSKDRFIFAVNKVDTLDVEKGETVDVILDNVRSYLAQHGIENPNIYPVSAEYAKLIRLHKAGEQLTRKQRSMLSESRYILGEDERMHLEKFAPLSVQARNILNQSLVTARNSDDEDEAVLIHTGVPAIEVAVNEYLDKYALTNKVKTAVDTFSKKIEEKALLANMMQSLKGDEEKRKALQQQLNYIESQMKEGKEAQKFRNKIERLDISNDVKNKFRSVRQKISGSLENVQGGTRLSRVEAERILMNLQRTVNDLQSDIQVDLENAIKETVINNAQAILNQYKNHLKTLMSEKGFSVGSYSAEPAIKVLVTDLPDTNTLINRYKHTENKRVKVGERWIENEDKRWYKPWTWFDKSGWYEDIIETRTEEYIDGAKLISDYFGPIKRHFNDNVESAQKEALREGEAFKAFFIREMDKLDDILKKKIKDMKELSANETALQRKIEEDRNKVIWLQDFIKKLSETLSV